MANIFSKKMKYILSISAFILFLYVLIFPCVKAEEIENYDLQVRDFVVKYINEIKDEVGKIDDLILDMKSQKEYIKYPAVRLNVQTPFLGIAAIVENKLNITEDVSVIDRTKKYSIRDVINKKIIKVPSFKIGSITILTEELDIDDENLTNEELNLVLYYLKSYLSQVEDVYKFVEKQKDNIFLDYVPKEIKQKVTELKNENLNLIKEIDGLNDKIVFLEFLASKEKQEEIKNEYLEIYNKYNEIMYKLSDILISNEELKNIENEISILKEKKDKLISNINLEYDIEMLNLDKKLFINNMQSKVEYNIEIISTYIENSYIKKELYESSDTYEQIVLYEVKHEEILEKLKNFNLKLENKLQTIENLQNTEEPHNIKVYTNKEDFELISNFSKEYLELLKSIRDFYFENNSYLLNEQKNRLETLIKHTDVNVIYYMNNIYFDMPKTIEKENTDYTCCVNIDKSIEILSKNLENLLSINDEVYIIYNNKVMDGQINS